MQRRRTATEVDHDDKLSLRRTRLQKLPGHEHLPTPNMINQRQRARRRACGGNSENKRFSWSNRPSGLAATDLPILGPKEMRVFKPRGELTFIPR
jgi:hypothetical protein